MRRLNNQARYRRLKIPTLLQILPDEKSKFPLIFFLGKSRPKGDRKTSGRDIGTISVFTTGGGERNPHAARRRSRNTRIRWYRQPTLNNASNIRRDKERCRLCFTRHREICSRTFCDMFLRRRRGGRWGWRGRTQPWRLDFLAILAREFFRSFA